jgi:hypothetical protein
VQAVPVADKEAEAGRVTDQKLERLRERLKNMADYWAESEYEEGQIEFAEELLKLLDEPEPITQATHDGRS